MKLYKQIPDSGNKYFISKSEGGLNPCIPRPNGSNLRFQNCVFFAVGAFAENTGFWMQSTNAENLFAAGKKNGFITSEDVPVHGALAVWASGEIGNGSDGAGHVAVVVEIGKDYFVTAESGWSAKKPFWTTTRSLRDRRHGQSAKYDFIGFVYPTGVLRHKNFYLHSEHESKEAVREVQRSLAELGYLRKNEIDGDFGKITLGAVCAFQLENRCGGVDGHVGQMTLEALADAMRYRG